MSEDKAVKYFEEKILASTDGKTVYPNCGCTKSYTRNGVPKKRYKCSACRKQYTVTIGTIMVPFFKTNKTSFLILPLLIPVVIVFLLLGINYW